MRASTLITLGLAASLVIGVSGQQPTFRSGVEMVEIDAIVTDRDGNPVTGLTADDFEVFEGRARQTITSFSLIDIPQATNPARFVGGAVPSDVVDNAAGRRRLYVIAIGTLPGASALKARRLLRQFVERNMSPGDIGALVYISQAISSSAQPFTTNHHLLLDAIERVGLPTDGVSNRPMADFRALTESIARIPAARKTMLLMTTGFADVFDVIDYQGGVSSSIDFDDFREGIRAATRGNVAIYTVDTNGLYLDDQTGESAPPLPFTGTAAFNIQGTGVPGSAASSIQSRSNLRMLAEMTGGMAVVNTNNFEDAFRQIARENSTYYVLGYTSSNTRQEGRFRRVRVRVTRPDLEVRARHGYVEPTRHTRPLEMVTVPANSASTALKAAIGNPIATPGLPIQVFAAPFRDAGEAKTAIVPLVINVAVAPLGLVERDGAFTGEVEIGHLSVDGRNRVSPGEFRRISLSLPADAYRRALTTGLRVLTETRLAPGRHQIRVAAGNGADVSGSVIYDIDVPNFTRGPLTLSGVALGTTGDVDDGITIRHREPLQDLADVSPLTAREFTRADTVTVVAAVYDNDRKSSHSIATSVELRTGDGRRVQGASQDVASRDMQQGEHVLTQALALSGVEPGRYMIRVEARSSANSAAVVTRDVPIEVR